MYLAYGTQQNSTIDGSNNGLGIDPTCQFQEQENKKDNEVFGEDTPPNQSNNMGGNNQTDVNEVHIFNLFNLYLICTCEFKLNVDAGNHWRK